MVQMKDFYGRLELQQIYKKNTTEAFLISIGIHLLLFLLLSILISPYRNNDERSPIVRIHIYDVEKPPLIKNIEIIPEIPATEKVSPDTKISEKKLYGNNSKETKVNQGPLTGKIDPKKSGGTPQGDNRNPSLAGKSTNKGPLRGGAPLGDGKFGTQDSKLNITENVKDGSGILPGGKIGHQSVKGEKGTTTGKIWGDKNGQDGVLSGHGTKDGKGQDGIGNVSGNGNGTGPYGPGSGVKKPTNFSIAWRDGGARAKMSGTLPKSPGSLTKPVQIKLLITVSPEGSVTKIVPLQKGDYTLESETIKTVRTWKFEQLKSNLQKVEQSAVVTFLFTLE